MVCTLAGAAIIPLWVLPSSWGALVAGGFLMQFCVQGAWGVIPIHLNELSPPQFRASFPGISYQIGNMISSPMAQIASIISESWHIRVWIPGQGGEEGAWETRPDYARTQAAMMTVIFILTCVWTACGDEARGSKFELAGVAGGDAAAGGNLEDGKKVIDEEDEDTGRPNENMTRKEEEGERRVEVEMQERVNNGGR